MPLNTKQHATSLVNRCLYVYQAWVVRRWWRQRQPQCTLRRRLHWRTILSGQSCEPRGSTSGLGWATLTRRCNSAWRWTRNSSDNDLWMDNVRVRSPIWRYNYHLWILFVASCNGFFLLLTCCCDVTVSFLGFCRLNTALLWLSAVLNIPVSV